MRTSSIGILVLLGALQLAAQPTIGTVGVSPTVVPAGSATTVTFTASITAPGLIAGGANLLRVTATGQTVAVLGILHDDGINGDAVAGDRIFSLRFTLNETSAGRVWLRSSAAFQGQLQRAQSSTIGVDVGAAATPLAATLTAAPAPNAAGWNRTNVTVSSQCSGGAGGSAQCPGVTIVSVETSGQVVTGVARDGANNTVTRSVTVKLDKTAPALAILSPPDNSTRPSPVTVTGTVADPLSGIAGVTCNAVAATVAGGSFVCSVPLVAGLNTIQVQARDIADNLATANVRVTRGGQAGPTITDFNPKTGPIGTEVIVTGTNLAPQPGTSAQVLLAKQGGGTMAAPVSSAAAATLKFTIPTGVASGTFQVIVNGQGVTSTIVLTVTPSASFNLTVAPGAADLIRGQSAAYAVRLNGTLTQLADLSLSGLPQGVTAAFKPGSIIAGQTSILTLTSPPAQALGTSPITVSASATVDGIPITQTAAAQLNIVAPTTSFLARTVVDDPEQTPIAGVTATMLGKDGSGGTTGCTGAAVSDAAGNLLIRNLPPSCIGRQLIGFDGTTAISPPGKYAGVNLVYTFIAGQVTTSPVLVHLPRIDNKETFFVTQNAPTDQSYSYRNIPGLSVTVYRGTTFTLPNGAQPNPFPLVAVQVPVDRLPDSKPFVPTMMLAFIVAFQPANAKASAAVAVFYPNTLNSPPGQNMPLMTLDPTRGTMIPYGTGTVAPDGSQVLPDPDPARPGRLYGITDFDWHGQMSNQPDPETNPSTSGDSSGDCSDNRTRCCSTPCPAQSGDPVDLSSGLQVYNVTDIAIRGSRGSVAVERIYRTLSAIDGPFGIGTRHNFNLTLDRSVPPGVVFTADFGPPLVLINPDNSRYFFRRVIGGPLAGKYIQRNVPSMRGVVITDLGNGAYEMRYPTGRTLTFGPDGPLLAHVTAIRDPNGNSITISRDAADLRRVTAVTDPVGRTLTFTYQGNHIKTITDSIGRTVIYDYNANNTLASVTDPEGNTTRYEYVTPTQLARIFDARNVKVIENTYDPSSNRVTSQTRPDGGVYRYFYPRFVNALVPLTSPILITTVADALGNLTTYRFDPNGFLLSANEQHPPGSIVPQILGPFAFGPSRVFTRDPSNSNLVLSIKGTGSCSVCEAPGAGDVSFQYDSNGNRTAITDALGNTTHLTYDPVFNQVTSITNVLGEVTGLQYDGRGNLIERKDARNNATRYTYDSFGLLTEVTDPLQFKTKYQYDAQGNLIAVTDALGNKTLFRYDAVSRLVETQDALGRKSAIFYDKLDRVVRTTNAKGDSADFTYDAVGNLKSVKDARGNTTSFTYDGLNRLVSRTDSLGKSDSRTYDLNGNLITFVDRRGQTSTFKYDHLNRLIEENYQDGSIVKRSYDAASRLVGVDDSASGVFAYQFDAAGRLLSEAGPFGTVAYVRDELGRVKSRQVAGQPAVAYTYDAAGNLTAASMPQASVSLAYNLRNQVSTMSRLNGVSSAFVYDSAARLLTITHVRGSTVLDTESYTYDAVGNRTVHTTGIAQALTTQPTMNQYNTANQLTQFGSVTLAHDANGNLVQEGPTTYAWDSRNRLKSIAVLGGATTNLTYDFAGNLIAQADSGPGVNLTKSFVLDELTNVASASATDGTAYSVLGGQSIDSHWAILPSPGQVEFGLTNGINSTVATVDSSGAVSGRFLYEPFGRSTASGSAYPFQYTGRLPVTSSLFYYRARFYSPTTGRFMSEDPIDFAGGDTNLYRYAANNPTNLTDPSGENVAYAAAAVTALRWFLYVARTPTGQLYIGITTDLARRSIQHGSRFVGNLTPLLSRVNYATVKGAEQVLIEAALQAGVPLANLINSVSPNSMYYNVFTAAGRVALTCGTETVRAIAPWFR